MGGTSFVITYGALGHGLMHSRRVRQDRKCVLGEPAFLPQNPKIYLPEKIPNLKKRGVLIKKIEPYAFLPKVSSLHGSGSRRRGRTHKLTSQLIDCIGLGAD